MESITMQQHRLRLLSLSDKLLNLDLKPTSGIDGDDGVRMSVKLGLMIDQQNSYKGRPAVHSFLLCSAWSKHPTPTSRCLMSNSSGL